VRPDELPTPCAACGEGRPSAPALSNRDRNAGGGGAGGGGDAPTKPTAAAAAAAAAAQEVQGRTISVNHARQLAPASSAGPPGDGGAVLGAESGGNDGEEGAAME
jgi:hypothetical protein